MNKNSASGRPDDLNPLWDSIFDHMPGAFWSHKGMSGQCPFCYAESTPQKMKFLISFDQSEFKGFHCFKCSASGSGYKGVGRLARQLGVEINTLEAGSLSGQGNSGVYRGGSDDEESGNDEDAVLVWPPAWIEDSEEIVKQGLAYLESRGIKNIVKTIEKFEIQFSEVVEKKSFDGRRFTDDYPCLVAPMASENGILGWTSRRLGSSLNPNEPKAIAYTGKGWKKSTLFGVRELDPRKPVTIVEGIMDALSTPNSVAVGGKSISNEQIDLLASTGARVFVFALDPTVAKREFATIMYRLHLEAPGSTILSVQWSLFGGTLDRDPNDRGWDEMEQIIRKTILDSMG